MFHEFRYLFPDILERQGNGAGNTPRLKSRARARVEQLFGLDRMMDDVEQTYRDVIRTAAGMKR